ncbi:hypothetical protein [uncultured Tenacibaculum sp.]|uniref:hypothetical protein n=1 Tax=uncultured Tenacibaculum sp. TaxID=174713 RepID=UPI002603DEED|nr:hypothetical protein [uncultured Tenacibaculum sp.]
MNKVIKALGIILVLFALMQGIITSLVLLQNPDEGFFSKNFVRRTYNLIYGQSNTVPILYGLIAISGAIILTNKPKKNKD